MWRYKLPLLSPVAAWKELKGACFPLLPKLPIRQGCSRGKILKTFLERMKKWERFIRDLHIGNEEENPLQAHMGRVRDLILNKIPHVPHTNKKEVQSPSAGTKFPPALPLVSMVLICGLLFEARWGRYLCPRHPGWEGALKCPCLGLLQVAVGRGRCLWLCWVAQQVKAVGGGAVWPQLGDISSESLFSNVIGRTVLQEDASCWQLVSIEWVITAVGPSAWPCMESFL